MAGWKFIGNRRIDFIVEEEIVLYSKKFHADIVCMMPRTEKLFVSQQEIILNERYAAFGFWVRETCYYRAGERNRKLKKGWEYELLIRLADQGRVVCIADARIEEKWAVKSDFYTDAYVLGRYAKMLQGWKLFDVFVNSCLVSVRQMEDGEAAMDYLEGMLSRDSRYAEICQATQPFLILLGDRKTCYNMLNDMALTLAQGLRQCGKNVQICDLSEEFDFILGKYYQAVIGFQAAFFDIYLEGRGCYLGDLVYGPKLQVMFDHPFWFWKQLENHAAEYYVLTHDENYVKFIKEYASSVSDSFLFPAVGNMVEMESKIRDQEVVFLGTYRNYRDLIKRFYSYDKKSRSMAAKYLKYLRKFLYKPAEFAFSKMLTDYGIKVNSRQIPEIMNDLGDVYVCIIFYYREKIIGTLLEAGITLHVYGNSWKKSPFADSKYMVFHKEIIAQDSGMVLNRAKISLNILSWHKGGCNERIINSMISGAVSVTDKSSYIEKYFLDGEELCCYDLLELEKLPRIIKWLLEHDDERKRIADNGRKKAKREYSAAAQANRLIDIIELIYERSESL